MPRYLRHSVRQTDEEKAANKIGEVFSELQARFRVGRLLPI
jgi:hypothetical protein